MSENIKPSKITSVPCELLQTIVTYRMVDYLVINELTNPPQLGFLRASRFLNVNVYTQHMGT